MSVKRVFRAESLDSATALLNEHAPEAQVIAGGTDLLVQIREEKNRGSIMVDITSVPELQLIDIKPDCIRIGAMVRFTDVVENDALKNLVPGLWSACKSVGSPQIRNLGTLGGNLANGSPAADCAPPLLAMNARVNVASIRGQKEIPLTEFYLGKGKTALQNDEMIESIIIPVSTIKPVLVSFEKLGLRNALAISRISASVCVTLDENAKILTCGVASGSLGLNPVRETELEEWLIGRTLDEACIKEAAKKFGDVVEERLAGRSSMPYKREAVQGVIKPALHRVLKNFKDMR